MVWNTLSIFTPIKDVSFYFTNSQPFCIQVFLTSVFDIYSCILWSRTLTVSTGICLHLHMLILKKIFMQLLWSLVFNSDILSATSFLITSEKKLITSVHILFCSYLIPSIIPQWYKVFYYWSRYLSRSSGRLFCCFIHFQGNTSPYHQPSFFSQCILPFQFHFIIYSFQCMRYFPRLKQIRHPCKMYV